MTTLVGQKRLIHDTSKNRNAGAPLKRLEGAEGERGGTGAMKVHAMTPDEHREEIIRRKIKFGVKYTDRGIGPASATRGPEPTMMSFWKNMFQIELTGNKH